VTKWIFGVFATIITTIAIITNFSTWNEARSDVDAYINRAQVAANRDDMSEYLTQAKTNMETIGMTSGHTAVFLTRADNDLALTYLTITRVIERLDSIKNEPENSTTYQVALDDMRGTVRELANPAAGWGWVHAFWWYAAAAVMWIICGLVAYFGGSSY
jgi:hypothetical protein